jgi:hypothetical protein
MRTFFVDSRSCVGSSSDFLFSLTRSLNVQRGRYRVDNLRVPLTFNLANRNNQNLYWLDNGSFRTAQIARGNYTSETLPAAIQAAFAAGGGSAVTVAYDQTTGTTTFAVATSGQSWTLLSDAQLLSLSSRYPGVDVNNPKSFNSVLGYPSSAITVATAGNVQTWSFPFISVLPYDTLYLCSSKLSGSSSQAPSGGSRAICVGVVDGNFGDVLVAASPWDVWQEVGPLSADSLDFQLTDRFGNAVNILAGNLSFQLTVEGSDE